MIVYLYDKTFEGLLTAIFEGYSRKSFPDLLLKTGETLPLFHDEAITIYTNEAEAGRVWRGLQKKLSAEALFSLSTSWLSELPGVDRLIFNYIRKAIDSPRSIEVNFGDPEVLELSQIYKKVMQEKNRVLQFLRFQKAVDGTFFAAINPLYNVLPLTISHFKDRFADQPWIIYDLKRDYGYHYDLHEATEIHLETTGEHLRSGKLSEALMDPDEKLFQQLWKSYFRAITIKERLNPKLHRQHMPARFWKYLPEKKI